MLQRQNLEVPQDLPSCCSTNSGKQEAVLQSATDVFSPSGERPGPLATLGGHADLALNGLTNVDSRSIGFDQNYSYSNLEDEDVFQQLGREADFRGISSETMGCDISPMDVQGHFAMDPKIMDFNDQLFDFQTQNRLLSSPSYEEPQTCGPNDLHVDDNMHSSSKSQGRGCSSADASEALVAVNPERSQSQQQETDPGSANPLSSTTGSPNMQTTIRFEGADPSTISAVVGVLVESKARFVFETR